MRAAREGYQKGTLPVERPGHTCMCARCRRNFPSCRSGDSQGSSSADKLSGNWPTRACRSRQRCFPRRSVEKVVPRNVKGL